MRWTVPAILTALVAFATTASAQFGFPEPTTERARMIQDVYAQIFIAALIVFVVVFAALAFILVRYRENGGKGRNTFEKERDNLKAEMAWTIIPLLIVLWVGVISYQALVDLDDLDDEIVPHTSVTITGFQWFWQADYGEDVRVSALPGPAGNLSATESIMIPADVPIEFIVTAADVIHSFNVVGLGQTLDAVPGQLNTLIVADGLPEGKYFTQCKENCNTPGHSYMRAMVEAIPVPEYEAWIEAKKAGAAAGLVQHIPVVADGTDLSTDKPTQVAKGATLRLQIANAGPEQTFTLGDQSVTIGADSIETVEVSAAEVGEVTLTGDAGGSIAFSIEEARTLDVELGAFEIVPGDIMLEADTVYVFNVANTHTTGHNIFIGMDGADGKQESLWASATLGPGETDQFIVVPTESGTLDSWCAVAGHYAAGMFGTVTVI